MRTKHNLIMSATTIQTPHEVHEVTEKPNLWETMSEDVVGLVIALIVVNIIFNGLLGGAWWAQIPVLAIGFALVTTIIEHLEEYYAVPEDVVESRDDMMGLWFARAMVVLIFGGLNLTAWMFQIPIVVLTILLIVSVIDFLSNFLPFLNERLNPEKTGAEHTAAIPEETAAQVYEIRAVPNDVNLCNSCNSEVDPDAKFCLYCGERL